MQQPWQIQQDCRQIEVRVKNGPPISYYSGIVTFSPDCPTGKWCGEDVPSTALGRVGESIVGQLRGHLTRPEIQISSRHFRVVLELPDEANKALAVIDRLKANCAGIPSAHMAAA